MLSAVSTGSAPKALGPYSQAIRAGQFLFVSGQVPIDPATGEMVPGGVSEQTRRALQNIGQILEAGGSSFSQVVRTTVYLADLSDFAAMNEVYATFFTAPQPARSTIQAARLPRDSKIEVDVIAFLG
jgi:2-iminobutanoate/2-iminopropanoate deaminase